MPTALLLAASYVPAVQENSTATVAAITLALGISNFSLAGLFCTHQVGGRARVESGDCTRLPL